MGLFICSKCGCIENTNLNDKGCVETTTGYPNLHSMEMYQMIEQGTLDGLLCSKCNTGKWHGDFKQEEANDVDKLLARFSKYNMTTPYDHPDGCITGGYHDYHVDERYVLFVKLFGEDVSSENNMLFDAYLNDRMNFNITCLEELENTKNVNGMLTEDDIWNTVKKCNVYPPDSDMGMRSGIRKLLPAVSHIIEAVKEVSSNTTSKTVPRKHWKETQNESDKEKALTKAKLKREIKKLKRDRREITPEHNVSVLLDQLSKEYKSL